MGRDDLLAGGGGEIEVRLDSLEDADGTWAVLRLFGAPRSPPRRSGWWWRPPTWRASGSARSAYPSAGLLGRNIAPDSPAEAAGLRPGDLLVRVGGQELRSPVTLAEAIARASVAPSGRITLGVARNALGELELELAQRPPVLHHAAPRPRLVSKLDALDHVHRGTRAQWRDWLEANHAR